MKVITIIVMLISAFMMLIPSGTAGAATGDGQPGDPNIQYYGRWDKSNSTSYHSYWGGAYLEVRFTGTTAKIKLGQTTTLLVNIDNTADRMLTNVSGTVDLTPTPLPSGTHTLRVAAQYDTKEIVFQGLILDAGASTVEPLYSDNPIIEFIGDSITTGADVTYGDGDAYAWLAAGMLGAEHTQISDPGITLIDGLANGAPGMESKYAKLKTPNYSTSPDWNFSTYTPSAIVVNLGSNDHYNNADPAVFQTHYTDFLAYLRGIYPETEIFGLRLFNGWYETEISNAVNARIAAGDTKVHYIDSTGWLEGYGTTTTVDYVQKTTGFSVHPSRLGHTKAAKQLAPILKPYLNLPHYYHRVEAEDLSLSNFSVESNGYASFLNNVRVPSSGTGSATYTFPGSPGTYDVQVNYFDENDGNATYSLYVNNSLVGSWTANQDLGSAAPDHQSLTGKMFSGVYIPQNSVIKVEGTFDTYEAARIDRVDFFGTHQIDENFNAMTTGQTPAGWIVAQSGGTVTVEEVPSATDKSVKINRTSSSSGSKTSLKRSFTPYSGQVTVEAKVRSDAASKWLCLPYIYDSAGTIAVSLAFDNGTLKANVGGTWTNIQSFSANTWYDLKVDMNTNTDTFSVYVDGVLKLQDVQLRSPVADIAAIDFYADNTNSGTAYVDNVKVYSDQ